MARAVLYNHIATLQMQGLGLVQFEPNLTIVDDCVVNRNLFAAMARDFVRKAYAESSPYLSIFVPRWQLFCFKTGKRVTKGYGQVCPESVAVEVSYVQLIPRRVQDLTGK